MLHKTGLPGRRIDRELDPPERAIRGVSKAESWLASPEVVPADPRDDAEVIAASVHDAEQFGTIFDRHANAISRYVSRRLGATLAEDVVSDTFVVAFRQRHRYDATRASARPWLLGIATNLIRRHRRDEARALKAVNRVGTDPVAESFTDGVEVKVAIDATSRALAAAVAGLDRRQRDVLLLITWGELTYDEVATALDVPVGTVRSRLSRARQALRTALGDTSPFHIEEERHDRRV